jgi:hypothetical protein
METIRQYIYNRGAGRGRYPKAQADKLADGYNASLYDHRLEDDHWEHRAISSGEFSVPDPMPIVGMEPDRVISAAADGLTSSRTSANPPFSSITLASLSEKLRSSAVRPFVR